MGPFDSSRRAEPKNAKNFDLRPLGRPWCGVKVSIRTPRPEIWTLWKNGLIENCSLKLTQKKACVARDTSYVGCRSTPLDEGRLKMHKSLTPDVWFHCDTRGLTLAPVLN